MTHGIVDVFAYQEALLLEAAFGIVILTMMWVGFRRWLQHKDRTQRLIADQAAEHTAQFAAILERVETRLKAVEQIVSAGDAAPTSGLEGPRDEPLRVPRSDRDTA